MFTSAKKDNLTNDEETYGVRDSAQRLRDDLRNTAGAAKDDLEDVARQAGTRMREMADTASRSVSDAADTVTEKVRDNPLQSVLIAVGVGFVLGTIFRR